MPSGKKGIPPGVKEAMRKEAAAHKRGSHGVSKALAESFGISELQAKRFLTHERDEIDDLRGKISDVAFMLAGQGLARISEDLSNDTKMQETPLKDKAMAVEKLVNTGVTARDGHQPKVMINFGDAVNRKLDQRERDRRLKEARQAQLS